MSDESVKRSSAEAAPEPRGASPTLTVVSMLAVFTACAAIVIGLPQSVRLKTLPPLLLRPAAVHEVLRRDAALAQQVPNNEDVRMLRSLYLEQGVAETSGPEPQLTFTRRETAITEAIERVRRGAGDAALRALRAEALTKLLPALEGALVDVERRGWLGSFPRVMRRYGMVTEDGTIRAPWFIVRTAYKARWNAAMGWAPTTGMARIELRAYHGWIAIGDSNAPIGDRMEALARYRNVGGTHFDEALGALLFENGDPDGAAHAYRDAHAKTQSLRHRNLWGTALKVANADDSR